MLCRGPPDRWRCTEMNPLRDSTCRRRDADPTLEKSHGTADSWIAFIAEGSVRSGVREPTGLPLAFLLTFPGSRVHQWECIAPSQKPIGRRRRRLSIQPLRSFVRLGPSTGDLSHLQRLPGRASANGSLSGRLSLRLIQMLMCHNHSKIACQRILPVGGRATGRGRRGSRFLHRRSLPNDALRPISRQSTTGK